MFTLKDLLEDSLRSIRQTLFFCVKTLFGNSMLFLIKNVKYFSFICILRNDVCLRDGTVKFQIYFCESKCDNLLRGAATKSCVRIGTVGDKLNDYGL